MLLLHADLNGNAILHGLPKNLIRMLPSVRNCAARLITWNSKFMQITPILKELHWLPVEQCIIFKILLIVFKALDNLAPIHISSLFEPYSSSRSLRSSKKLLLVVPRSNLKVYGDRAFPVVAPRLWNAFLLKLGLVAQPVFKKKT